MYSILFLYWNGECLLKSMIDFAQHCWFQTVTTPKTRLITSSLGVLDLSDLVPDGSRSDAAGIPLSSGTNGEWTVRLEDYDADAAAAEISVSDLSRIAHPGAEQLPVDDSMAKKERDELPVAWEDVSRSVTSLEGSVAGDNRTSVNTGNLVVINWLSAH